MPSTGSATRKERDLPAYVRLDEELRFGKDGGEKLNAGNGAGGGLDAEADGDRMIGKEGVRLEKLEDGLSPLSMDDSVFDRPSMRLATFPGDAEGEAGVVSSPNICERSRGILVGDGGGAGAGFERFLESSSLSVSYPALRFVA